MSVIGEALIDVRPNTAPFERGVRSAVGRAVKVAAGAFGAVGVFEIGKSAITNALNLQEATDRLALSLKNIGVQSDGAKAKADAYLNALRDTSGFTKIQLTDSLARMTAGIGSAAKGQRDLTLAVNVARARNMDLAAAQAVVGRVAAGSTGSLRRLGIAFQAQTPLTDKAQKALAKLQAQYQKATGASKKAMQGELTTAKAHLVAAKAADKATAAMQALALLTKRFGGGAAEFAKGYTGQLALLKNTLVTIETQIGTALLPSVIRLAQDGTRVVTDFAHVWPQISDAIHPVVVAVGAITSLIGTLGGAIGAVPITAAIASYLVLSKTISATQGAYSRLTAATATQTAAQAAEVVSTEAGVVAARAQVAALGQAATATEVYAAKQALLAAEQDAAAASTAVASRGLIAGRAAMAALGGPVGIATLAVAALAAGLIYLSQQESAAALATDHLAASTKAVSAAINNVKTDTASLAVDRLTVAQDKLAHAQALVDVAEARHAVSQSTAAHGSDAYKALVLSLSRAKLALKGSTLELKRAEDQHLADRFKARGDNAAYTRSIAAQAANTQNLIHVVTRSATSLNTYALRVKENRDALDKYGTKTVDVGKAFDGFISRLRQAKSKDAGDVIGQHNLDLLTAFSLQIKKIPSPRQIKILLSNTDAKAKLQTFENSLFAVGLLAPRLKATTAPLGDAMVQGVIQGITSLTPALTSTFAGSVAAAAKAGAKVTRSNSPSKLTRDQIGIPLGQGVVVGILSQGKHITAALTKTLRDAVDQAKQGLAGFASTLSGTIGTLLDAQLAKSPEGIALQKAQATQAALDAQQQLADAKKAVAATVAGTAARAKAEADLNVLVAQQAFDAAQAKVDAEKTANDQTLADLADALSRGLISQKTYQAKVVALLKAEGVNYKAAGSTLGLAFADGFVAELQDMLRQAGLIAKANLPGSGLRQATTDPLQVLKDELRTARQSIKDAKKAATDASGPGGKTTTPREARTIRDDERLAKLIAAALKATERIHIENLNVSAAVGDTGDKLAEEILAALGGALA